MEFSSREYDGNSDDSPIESTGETLKSVKKGPRSRMPTTIDVDNMDTDGSQPESTRDGVASNATRYSLPNQFDVFTESPESKYTSDSDDVEVIDTNNGTYEVLEDFDDDESDIPGTTIRVVSAANISEDSDSESSSSTQVSEVVVEVESSKAPSLHANVEPQIQVQQPLLDSDLDADSSSYSGRQDSSPEASELAESNVQSVIRPTGDTIVEDSDYSFEPVDMSSDDDSSYRIDDNDDVDVDADDADADDVDAEVDINTDEGASDGDDESESSSGLSGGPFKKKENTGPKHMGRKRPISELDDDESTTEHLAKVPATEGANTPNTPGWGQRLFRLLKRPFTWS